MVPDEQKRMKLFLDICQRDPLSGNRHSGEKIKRYLKKSGYHKIVVHSKCVNAKEKEKEKKELIFDTFFSYLPLDYAYLCETEPEESKTALCNISKRICRKVCLRCMRSHDFYMLQIAGREVYDICTGE